MKNRFFAIAAVVALIVVVAGITLAPNTPAALAAEHEIAAADAGSVLVNVDASTLSVADVTALDGWLPEVEVAEGREVEIDFRNGELQVQVNAELEDGELRIRVRERSGSELIAETETAIALEDNATTSTTLPDDNSTTSTTMPDNDDESDDDDNSTTSTTMPDNEDETDDDDNSTTSTTMPDNEDESDEDDNSGPGNGDDDDEDEDERSSST